MRRDIGFLRLFLIILVGVACGELVWNKCTGLGRDIPEVEKNSWEEGDDVEFDRLLEGRMWQTDSLYEVIDSLRRENKELRMRLDEEVEGK